jgi:hypothetical protein
VLVDVLHHARILAAVRRLPNRMRSPSAPSPCPLALTRRR